MTSPEDGCAEKSQIARSQPWACLQDVQFSLTSFKKLDNTFVPRPGSRAASSPAVSVASRWR